MTINSVKVPDILTSDIRKWFFNTLPTSTTSMAVHISFPKMVLIRYVYTAWNVTSLIYQVLSLDFRSNMRNNVLLSETKTKKLLERKTIGDFPQLQQKNALN